MLISPDKTIVDTVHSLYIFLLTQYFRLFVVPNEKNFRNLFSDSNQSNSSTTSI